MGMELDLSLKVDLHGRIDIRPVGKASKNATFIIYQNDLPAYFIKKYNPSEPNLKRMVDREVRALKYFNASGFLRTPVLRKYGSDYIITDYAGTLSNVSFKDALDSIAEFHAKSANSFPTSPEFDDSTFQNDRRIRGKIRLRKHSEIVKLLWPANELERAIDSVPPSAYEQMPKILTHGDLHPGNIQRTESGGIIFVDFERAYFDSPTWDFSRALLDMNSDEVEDCIERYTRLMRGTVLAKIGAEKLRKLILGDSLYRLITDFISDRQNPEFKDVATRHYERDKMFVQNILIPNLIK